MTGRRACYRAPVSTDFVIVRHGQTDWNLERRIQGSTDVPLNDTGIAQARHTSEALRTERFDAVASSHLQRAELTAATIGAHHVLRPLIDPRLTERSFAEVEGWKVEDVKALFPSFDDIAGVEPWSAVTARMLAAMEALAEAAVGGRVLVVTHGSAIRGFLSSIQGVAPREVQSLLNCSLTEVRLEDGAWSIRSFNDNTHLPEHLRT